MSSHAPRLSCMYSESGASSTLDPVEAWMLYGLHYGEGRDLNPREPETERRHGLDIK